MKILAILANIALLILVAYILYEQGMPNGEEWMLFIPMTAAPILNMVALFANTEDSWLALYFRRKALEEKKKIEDLKDS
ncbi:MAG TPA: hypothetical protein DIW43_08375 [Spongiibacteraceae bacterium]|nr:hypothetical protein [Spongiibacteraceae bacterium]HCS27457.1 hypothetical protein [Spongiibacteraceae bacterium]|tara:strand:- start:1165 stop:1401 length:237 start_codon:yes stop_codon:yes gene_type:complete